MEAFLTETTAVINEAFFGSLDSVLTMAKIVIPLMVAMEWAKEARLVEKMVRSLKPVMRGIGLSPAAAFPLLVGVLFGLAYGAGLIIEYAKEGELSQDENYLLNVFLSICHAMVEDPLLFAVIGANYGVMMFTRVAAAVVVTRLFAFLIGRRSANEAELS